MQIRVMKNPNSCGYYGISYFDSFNKSIHFVMKSLDECLAWVADFSDYNAKLIFDGNKFQVWEF